VTRVELSDGVGYETRQSGAGPALVLLHGFADSSRTWEAVWDVLGRDHRLLALDLLGHGGSDAPGADRQAVERQAADIAAIVERLAGAPVDVLGYSLGARVALWLALTAPALIERLVLVSPSAGIADPAERTARVRVDERWAALLESGDLAAFHEAWEAQPVFASRSRMPAEARDALRGAHLAANGPALARSLRGAGQGVMTPLQDRLADIEQPALVVTGELDPTGRERGELVAALLPGGRLSVMADAGHAPQLERPRRFAQLTTTFLAPASVGAASIRGGS
jgi:2-succinyl-6-hydroxy-2,4-cyclohexadiene-1-carboxylate synthase